MKRSNWLVGFAVAAGLWLTTATVNAQIIVAPPRTTVTTYYGTPYYGPYINGGLTYYQPTAYSYPLAPTYPVYPGASFGTTISYSSPRINVTNSYYPAYYGTPYYQPPVVTPYVSPLLYRRW